MSLNYRTLIALVVSCLLLSSCGAIRGERVVAGLDTEAEVATTENLLPVRGPSNAVTVSNVGQSEAFAFSATELFSRNAVVGTDLVNDQPTIITFVVPQCPVCVAEGLELAESAANNPEITYVLVHSGGTADAYDTYISSSGLTMSNVVHLDDSPGLLWARFGVIQQPTSVQIDAEGEVTQSLGALGEDGLALTASRLLAASSA